MTVFYKSKSQMRSEGELALAKFLASGGQVEVVKARKAPKQKMVCRASKSASGSTGGFAAGYSKSTIGQ